jgi:catechol 2,3-dioxygenase-like lactoylglutathione lyase family enzyme
MQPSRIHHVGLPVTDLDRSVAWYREALGLTHEAAASRLGLAIEAGSRTGRDGARAMAIGRRRRGCRRARAAVLHRMGAGERGSPAAPVQSTPPARSASRKYA